MSKPIIYCDMDGVLADFKTGAQRTTGMSINKWMNIPSSKEKWALIKAKKNFWSTLPWMSGGKQLWSYISKFDPHILSAYVEESFDPNCIPGKTEWLRRNAGMSNRSKINLVRRKRKRKRKNTKDRENSQQVKNIKLLLLEDLQLLDSNQ